jgi:glycosyltransferase involved in cell wall biosynthesis
VTLYKQPEALADVPRYERFFQRIELAPHLQPSPAQLALRVQDRAKRYPRKREDTWNPELWAAVQKMTSTRRYDVVHFWGTLALYETLALCSSLPCMVTVDALPSQLHAAHIPASADKKTQKAYQAEQTVLENYETWLWEYFSMVMVSQPRLLEALQGKVKARVGVIPIGVDPDYYVSTGYDPRTQALLLAGDFQGLGAGQTLKTFTQTIFPSVRRSFPKLVAYVVGRPLPSGPLEVVEGVQWIEGGADWRPYFELANVYIDTNPHGGLDHQALLLASLSMMTPPVVSDAVLGGLPLREGGEFFLARTSDETIRAIIRLLREDHTRLYMQISGRERIQADFTWAHHQRRYLAAYQALARA